MQLDSLFQKHPRGFKFILAVLVVYTIVHILYSGVYYPIFRSRITAYALEMENVRSAAVNKQIDPDAIHSYAHYGPTFFLINYPLRHLSNDELNWVVLYANYIFLILSFLICMKYFALSNAGSNKLLYGLLFFILWFNFSPFFYAIATRFVEIFEFFLICLAFHAFQTKRKVLCAICLSMAALTKMLPAVFLFYLFFKDRKTFIYAVVSCVLILSLGHLVYGPTVGFSYPFHLLSKAAVGYNMDGFFENTSLKGLIWRIFSGFRWSGLNFAVNKAYLLWAQATSSLFQIAGAAFLAIVSFSKYRHGDNDKISLEFALVSITMILLSPFANYVYVMLAFFAYAVGFYFIAVKQFPVSKTDITMYVISYLLVGNFFPLILVKYIPWDFVNNLFGNAIPASVGSGADYLFYWQGYCFPTYGYILLFIFIVSLLKKSGFLKFSLRREE